MMTLTTVQDPKVRAVFYETPAPIRAELLRLRALILEVSSGLEDIGELEETLKWGEPSYLAKSGSTIRLGWKPARPHLYFMYFHCRTKLVPTFKELYSNDFDFEGDRAIVFRVGEREPTESLKH